MSKELLKEIGPLVSERQMYTISEDGVPFAVTRNKEELTNIVKDNVCAEKVELYEVGFMNSWGTVRVKMKVTEDGEEYLKDYTIHQVVKY